ncbi:hypothetical protein H6504_00960 [Candidatus Woesearchaeota archaeon]|nr:hypothetical protein [Candidatus Woesearchaeota archaeon]
MEYAPDAMFTYNQKSKRTFSVMLIIVVTVLALLVTYYAMFLRHSESPIILAINMFFGHIIGEITASTQLGLFYAAMFGGLFFVIMSMELLFITFFDAGHHPAVLISMYLLGMTVAYSVNYLIGMRLGGISKKIIGPQQFYKIKGVINKHGGLAIFVFNVLPLPSQPLSAMLGVFKYNRPRFYTFFLLGQGVKYTAIVLFFMFGASLI